VVHNFFSGNLTYFCGGFRSSDISHNGRADASLQSIEHNSKMFIDVCVVCGFEARVLTFFNANSPETHWTPLIVVTVQIQIQIYQDSSLWFISTLWLWITNELEWYLRGATASQSVLSTVLLLASVPTCTQHKQTDGEIKKILTAVTTQLKSTQLTTLQRHANAHTVKWGYQD